MSEKPIEFWVINISNKDIMLGDLGLSIPKGRSFNLLHPGHFKYTWEQIVASVVSGSISKRRQFLKLSDTAPVKIKSTQIELNKFPIASKRKTAVKLVERRYDELPNINSDEKFADEFSNPDADSETTFKFKGK